MVSSTGCGIQWLTWSYDFTSPNATLDDWYYKDMGDGSFCNITAAGLSMRHFYLSAPHWFSGDMELIAQFFLDVDNENNARFEFGIANDILWESTNDIWADMWCLGDENEDDDPLDDEAYEFGVWQDGDDPDLWTKYPVPWLNRSGLNTVKISKIGNRFSLYVNGIIVKTLVSDKYTADSNYVTMDTGQSGGTLIIKNVIVKYTDDISELWPIM